MCIDCNLKCTVTLLKKAFCSKLSIIIGDYTAADLRFHIVGCNNCEIRRGVALFTIIGSNLIVNVFWGHRQVHNSEIGGFSSGDKSK